MIYNKLLIISGILFIFSLFLCNPIVLTICLTLFIIVVIINCYNLWKGQNIIKYILNETNLLYILPLIIFGIVTTIAQIVCLWI